MALSAMERSQEESISGGASNRDDVTKKWSSGLNGNRKVEGKNDRKDYASRV